MYRHKRSFSEILFDVSNFVFMIVILFIMIYPFLYIFNYSISSAAYISGNPLILPKGINFDAYKLALSEPNILHGLFISVARTVIGPLLMIVVTTTAGYVMSREELLGIKFFRRYFVFTMYFSGGIIPLYVVIHELHLTGSFWVYVIPSAVSVFNMILIKTYTESLPTGLEEAAIIDGANDIQLFYKIVFPLSMPVIAAVTLFSCVGQWNAFIDTQLYNAMSPNLYPIQYILYNSLQSINSSNLPQVQMAGRIEIITPQSLKMAMTIITVVPILFVYPILQRYFIKGLLIGSIKG